MLNLNLLRVFHEIVEKQSVAKAATALFISQPAVSNSLKRLQKETGVQLFYKTGRSLTLTNEGKKLYVLTTQMFALEQQIEALLGEAEAQAKHTIRIGLATIYERFGISEVQRYFSDIDDGIAISVHSGNSRTLQQKLEEHSIDLAIAGDVITHPKFNYLFYKRHEIMLVVPKGHRLYGKKEFSHSDIHGERMVLKEKGSSVRKTVDAFIENYAVAPILFMELSNLDSILNLISSEKCLTFLPDLSVAEQVGRNNQFSVARCADTELSFATYIVWHASGIYSESTRRLIERLCAVVSGNPQL